MLGHESASASSPHCVTGHSRMSGPGQRHGDVTTGVIWTLIIGALLFISLSFLTHDKEKMQQVSDVPLQTAKQTIAQIKALDPHIEAVQYYPQPYTQPLVIIHYAHENTGNGIDFMYKTMDAMRDISKKIIATETMATPDCITFIIQHKNTINGDNKFEKPLMELHFPGNELKKMNWKFFTSWSFLNMVEKVRLEQQGVAILQTFCAQENVKRYAGTFCVKALTR